MTVTTKQYSIWAASMVASLAAAFAAVGATRAGSYSFEVSGAGTQIRQGGAFGAAAGATATLGSVRLGSGGPYEARLGISTGGGTVQCAEWTGRAP
ncbi:MAG: hypothetical protein DCC69_00265 [Hyphomicrobiales bacterium]|nr:MAG: hypothetical protein DCC69_00265 [Hyphomicrobiales bacterium]